MFLEDYSGHYRIKILLYKGRVKHVQQRALRAEQLKFPRVRGPMLRAEP